MDRIEFLAGINWSSQVHQVCILDGDGGVLGERAFEHSGEGFARMADWILKVTGAGERTAAEHAKGDVLVQLVRNLAPPEHTGCTGMDQDRDSSIFRTKSLIRYSSCSSGIRCACQPAAA